MPLGMFHYLHTLSLNQSRTEEGQKNKANEQMVDEIEDSMS